MNSGKFTAIPAILSENVEFLRTSAPKMWRISAIAVKSRENEKRESQFVEMRG